MKHLYWCVAAGLMLGLAGASPAAGQPAAAPAVLTLPVTGNSHGGFEFTGTISINRFEEDNGHVVAFGLVAGVLSRGGKRSAIVVKGEERWPVAVKAGGRVFVLGRPMDTAKPRQIAWSPGEPSPFRLLPVQASCPVVNLALGPINVDLLGVQVALSAVTFDLGGASGTPLGEVVCQVSETIGIVGELVGVLNGLLGLVTGLLGGLTGGLGGVVPVP
jgi:hypothetical protein